MQEWKVGGYFLHNSYKSPHKQTAFLFQQGTINRKYLLQPRDIPIKCIWNIPFSMIGAFLPGIRSVNPHLLCKCHPVKGLTGLLAFLCLAGLEKQIAGQSKVCYNRHKEQTCYKVVSLPNLEKMGGGADGIYI